MFLVSCSSHTPLIVEDVIGRCEPVGIIWMTLPLTCRFIFNDERGLFSQSFD